MTTNTPTAVDVEELDMPPVQEDQHEEFSILKIEGEKDLKAALERMDAALSYIDQVRNFVMKRTKPNDWTDQSGNPYFGESGCNRFMAPFQFFEKDIDSWTVDAQGIKRGFNEKNVFEGEIRLIMFRGVIGSKLLGIEASFEGGSRLDDGFKSKDDILFYSMKAKANWRGRGFRKVLGMENLTWADLAAAGIKQADVKKVERPITAKADTKEAAELWNILLEMNAGDVKKAEDYLEKMTTSEKYKGKRRPAHLSEKALAWIGPKVKGEYHKMFPDKKTATSAPEANGGSGDHPTDDQFRSSVENLQNLVSAEDYKAVLKEFGVAEAVEIPAAKRIAFMTTLASKRKGERA